MTALNLENARQGTRTMPMFAFHNFRAAPRTLKQAVDAAVCAVGDDDLQSLATDSVTLFSQTRALLALVTHCYARNIFSSVQVAEMARHDTDFAGCGADDLPDAHVIRRFRVDNRDAIHRCVTAALRFLADEKIATGELTKVSDRQLAEEASRRIIMAAFMDNLEMEAQPVADSPAELSYLFAKPPLRVH
jgi:transposase